MAFCRWSPDSDLSIYYGLDHGNPGPRFTGILICVHPDGTEYEPYSHEAMIAHIEEHKALGHKVPEGLIQKIRDNQEEEGDDTRKANWINPRRSGRKPKK